MYGCTPVLCQIDSQIEYHALHSLKANLPKRLIQSQSNLGMSHACPKEIQNANIMGCCTCFCAKLSKKLKFSGFFHKILSFLTKFIISHKAIKSTKFDQNTCYMAPKQADWL